VALAPDVILAPGSPTTGPLLQATRTVPIVFATVPDPVGSGFVQSLARPGGNATGFIAFEYGTAVKWLELLKQIVPDMQPLDLRFADCAGDARAIGSPVVRSR
jgi:putative tryptophan/tyrosine transport system substrate-binding protein